MKTLASVRDPNLSGDTKANLKLRNDERPTSHLLLPTSTTNQYQTNDADLPEGRSWQAWDRVRIDDWAARMGPATMTVIGKIFEAASIEEAG